MSDALSGDDKAELDRQYAPSRTVERLDHYIWLYGEQSRLARERFGSAARLGVSYGADPRHRLDYFPTGAAGAPLVVFIHGGFWQALSKDFASFPALALTGAGVNYAAISYRLGQITRLDGIVDDVVAAIAALVAGEFDFDRDSVVLSGHSAGAHLAAMAAVRGVPDVARLAGLQLIGGVFDLRPVRRSYVNDVMRMDDAEALRNSPALQSPVLRCPTIVTYAEHETAGFAGQSKALADAWSAIMPRLDLVEQPGLNHFNSPLDMADPGSRLTRGTLALAKGEGP